LLVLPSSPYCQQDRCVWRKVSQYVLPPLSIFESEAVPLYISLYSFQRNATRSFLEPKLRPSSFFPLTEDSYWIYLRRIGSEMRVNFSKVLRRRISGEKGYRTKPYFSPAFPPIFLYVRGTFSFLRLSPRQDCVAGPGLSFPADNKSPNRSSHHRSQMGNESPFS